MKILLLGKGYIGSEILYLKVFDDIHFRQADITRLNEIEKAIEGLQPEAVINAAGKTNLEWCRDNKAEALLVNVAGPLNILNVCKAKNIYFVHIGSVCLYEGAGADGRGFTEEDPPQPGSFYGQTKALCDDILMRSGYEKLLIARIRQPFSGHPHPRSIITKVISFNQHLTTPQSTSYVPDAVRAIKYLLDQQKTGIYNICNPGVISPYEICQLAIEQLKLDQVCKPINKAEFNTWNAANNRDFRVDTIVNGDKLKNAGFEMPDIKERILEVLRNYQ